MYNWHIWCKINQIYKCNCFSWDNTDAEVVCRQLGFLGGRAFSDAHFGAGLGIIWLDDVHCNGSEMTLEDCDAYDWGHEDCDHYEDAGVMCGRYNFIKRGHTMRCS